MTTKKKSWTHLISASSMYGVQKYKFLPRKRKKRIKRFFEKSFCYSNKDGATIFDPHLLSHPVQFEIFKKYLEPIPQKQTIIKFRRHENY